MIDIEKIRQTPDRFRLAIKTKRIPLDIDKLLDVDGKRRDAAAGLNALRENRNRLTEEIARHPENENELKAQAKQNGDELSKVQAQYNELDLEYRHLTALVPSLPAEGVPVGDTDQDNVELRRQGLIEERHYKMKDHLELAHLHRMLDLEGARTIAGSRAYALRGMGALLETALMRFALDRILARKFTLVVPPLMVNADAMFGTGYFPLGEDNAYEVKNSKLFLTGTSEVGMVAMYKDRLIARDELPIRFVGNTTCFRREAGAAGRDTKGLYRVHQFQKIEQVVFCENNEETARKEHQKLLQNAEEILQELELPYRVVAVCTGDMGLGQVEKHDIETWMPSRNQYGETHSCSTFHDFQTRRLNIKYKDEAGAKRFVYTLNNTALASPRILIPFLENHQREDGTIHVPRALRPYLADRERLGPDQR
jgi:seryl-tRNA synthetase